MTKVIFLIEKDSASEVFAYFPENNGSYSHIGQHSGCSLDYVNPCREAITNEYGYLLAELIDYGYHDLKIMNNQKITCHRKPTKGEIKFGEGATHYRDFTAAEIGVSNKTKFLKVRFKADDGLYYSRY